MPLIKEAMAAGELFRAHAFEYACAIADIDHRTIRPKHPRSSTDQETLQWSVSPENGQVERMNRTIKDATAKRLHYASHDQIRQHLADFVSAYNFARRLKALRGLTPYEAICKASTDDPVRFIQNPHHQTPGPNI